MAFGRFVFAAALSVALLPEIAGAAEAQRGPAAPQAYNPDYAVAPGFAPTIDSLWLANPSWGSPFGAANYRPMAAAIDLGEDPASPSFDIGGYDAMWNETWFSEMAAYGGLERDALRIAGMRAMNETGAIPYGHLSLQREFEQGRQFLGLGAYGLTASVQPTAISGFGSDSYTDMAVDATWRWIAHPERGASDAFSAHVLVLHEGEDLLASQAIFGTNRSDELTVFRGDASYSWSAGLTQTVQYFQVTGTPDPVRLGTLDGSPDSKGWIAEVSYLPSADARSPLAWFHVRLSLQLVSYSQFDGTTQNAAHNNTVLFHLTAGGDGN